MKEGTTEAPMSPQELELQKRKTKIDLMISRKRNRLDQQNKGGQSEKMKESTEDSLRDRRMERWC